ncbi:response regulator [Massilia sp. NR 4-1]|uniref:response regulator n=1 Tax=Massilia sp. NR 4-1 TaxID=1678028 RepID=UPI0009E38244|nr:response regulator [Massilia sp. NR 4-1]
MMRTVASKMALLTATALLGLALLTALGRYEMEQVYEGANFGNVNAVPSLIALDTLRRNFLLLGTQLQRQLNSSDDVARAEAEKQVAIYRQGVATAIIKYETDGCLGSDCFADAKDKMFLSEEKVVWARYDSLLDRILQETHKGQPGIARAQEVLNATAPLADQISRLITDHIAYNAAVATRETAKAVETKSDALYLTLGACALMLAAIGGLGFLTARSIIAQLGGEPAAATAIVSRLAGGDVSERIDLKPGDDASMMARVHFLSQTMERLASRAEAIGRGNLDDEVALASEQDRLGKAINDMIRMLRASRAEDERRNWLKDGYSQLTASLTGDLSTEQLADAAIGMMGHYLEAGRGVFYLYVEASQQLELVGSYMYTERNHIGARFALGEGAVGQAARERKPIILTLDASDENTPPITTGTSSATPRYTYTYPLLHEVDLVGVIELASFTRFDDKKTEFLAGVSGMLASLLYVAEQRVHIRKLLGASEASEKELRIQSEQLRDTNAQMEEQQQQLQQQAEELQQTNSQMEEQQQQLQQQAEELRQSNAQMEEQQQQMQLQNEQLQEARRLQEAKTQQLKQSSQYKSEFLSNMSHELRTPLNSIILLSKMMLSEEEGKLDGESAKWAQVIHRSGQELLRLINDVLDLSKVEAGRMELHAGPVSGADICTELQSMFEHLARDKGLSLSVINQLEADFVSDWDKLSQILRNLLSNAVKFTREGSISVTVGRRPGHALPIFLSVRDSGVGIAPDKRNVIFEAFQQADGSTSREFGGTGLGLTISLRFAQMLGGTIELQSELGKGSEFTVLLPDAMPSTRPGTATAAPAISPVPAPPGDGHLALPAPSVADDRDTIHSEDAVILLIDDDPAFCQSLLAMNRRLGYKTLLAHSGEEGLDLAWRHRPHGILLDLGLPDMDGAQVLHEIKSRRELARIPVHIVSARDRDDAFLQQGAIGFLQKPADDHRLAQAEAALLAALERSEGNSILVVENGGISAAEVAAVVGPERGPVLAATPDGALEQALSRSACRVAIIDLGDGQADTALTVAARLRAAAPELALVFFASRALDDEEANRLRHYSECVIVKAPQAERRLLENVERFLRRVPQEHAAMQAAPTPASGKVLSGRHILLVDDDPRNLFVITAALERHGARLSNAVNGKRALEFLAQNPVDLVLMDIMMPEMDGFQTIAAMRRDAAMQATPVLALTAKAAPSDQAEIMAAGADDYLAKPVDYDVLVAKVLKWSGGRGT